MSNAVWNVTFLIPNVMEKENNSQIFLHLMKKSSIQQDHINTYNTLITPYISKLKSPHSRTKGLTPLRGD